MSGFAFVVHDGAAREIDIHKTLEEHGDLVWAHLTTNNDEAKAWLAGEAQLPAYVVEALTANETRPRCDAIGEGAVINMRGLTSDPDRADPLASVRLFACGGRVFSVTRKPLNALEPVRALVSAGKVLDPGDLISELATAITEELDPFVAGLGDSLDDCEEQVGADHAFGLRRGVNKVRSQAIGYRRFLYPQRAALEKLATLPCDWLNDDDRVHLSAAADRAARMSEELEAIRERSALIHETLTDLRSEQIDQRSLIIAVVALVFLPLTFITGLLGMNVEGIPFAHKPWAFDGVVLVCVLLAGVISAYFLRQHWFNR